MEIIALSGYARSGKDEVARVLVQDHGFVQVAFADKLREVLYALNPIVQQQRVTTMSLESDYQNIYVQDVIDSYGWDHYKGSPWGPEIRRLLQRLGTEAGRQTLWDTIWIDAALADLDENDKVVISDARFINEFEAVTERGGKVWRIHRPGVGPANEHASELEAIEYHNFSLYLHNDSDLGTLRKVVAAAYKTNREVGVLRAGDYNLW